MVGRARGRRRGVPRVNAVAAEFRREVGAAYEAAASSWALGAAVIYAHLAEALVDNVPPLGAGPVLDLCAGAGAASVPLVRRGRAVIALDLAPAMLAVDRARRPPAIAADALALPLRSRSFAAVVVACGLNHATDPVAFLAEAGRVTRADGFVATSTFAAGWTHPAKSAVDEALVPFGFQAPHWHRRFKADIEPATAEPGVLRAIALRAGLRTPRVTTVAVAVDVTAEQAVGWRFAMASHVGFLATLAAQHRRQATDEAIAAVRRRWEPLVIPLLVLCAQV